MSELLSDSVAARWARLGVMLNVRAAPRVPDIERLLLDTARAASTNTRLLVLAATWLSHYGGYVAVPRLARLVRGELEAEHRPTLGLLLEFAEQQSRFNASCFRPAIEACGPVTNARPLSDVERLNPLYRRLAEQRASALSRKWGRWITDNELKDSALRPPEWIRQQIPSLAQLAPHNVDTPAPP